MTEKRFATIGGLEMTAPLDVDVERRLYPIIREGRRAAADLESEGVVDPTRRRELLRRRHDGQEAEAVLLRATLGLVRARVVERGYRFGNDELEAAGVEGLVNALQRFDPDQGTRFSTYANYWIMKMVNQSIQQQSGLSDAEMRLILRFQKLVRSNPERQFMKRDVAASLGISQAKAHEVMQLSRDLQTRRFQTTGLDDARDVRLKSDPADVPSWVIDALHAICGDDFDAFWQSTFRTMSVEEIARAHGMTRQGMSKRLERCRRAVRESPEAQRLQAWFAHQ